MAAFTTCWILALIIITFDHQVIGSEINQLEEASTVTPTAEKRSQEDIMFGNQQNKPAAGMVDDLLTFPNQKETSESPKETSPLSPGKVKETERLDRDSNETSEVEEKKRGVLHHTLIPATESMSSDEDKSIGEGSSSSSGRLDYDYLQDPDVENQSHQSSLNAEDRYPLEAADEARGPMGSLVPSHLFSPREDAGDYPEEDYEGVLYRRKRNPDIRSKSRLPTHGGRGSTVPRLSGVSSKKKHLYSDIDDLLGRDRRAPRSAIRMKRQSSQDMEHLLDWFDLLNKQPELAEEYLGPLASRLVVESKLSAPEEEIEAEVLPYFYNVPSSDLAPESNIQELVDRRTTAMLVNPLSPPMYFTVGGQDEQPQDDRFRSSYDPEFYWRYLSSNPSESRDGIENIPPRRSPSFPVAKAATNGAAFYPLDYRYVMMSGQKMKKRDYLAQQEAYGRGEGDQSHLGGYSQMSSSADAKGRWGSFGHGLRRHPNNFEADPRDMTDRLYAWARMLSNDEEEEAMIPEDDVLERRKRKAVPTQAKKRTGRKEAA